MTNHPPLRSIEPIPLITIEPRSLNTRLWTLFAKQADGSLTHAERVEYDAICAAAETEQDNSTGE